MPKGIRHVLTGSVGVVYIDTSAGTAIAHNASIEQCPIAGRCDGEYAQCGAGTPRGGTVWVAVEPRPPPHGRLPVGATEAREWLADGADRPADRARRGRRARSSLALSSARAREWPRSASAIRPHASCQLGSRVRARARASDARERGRAS